jgi:CRP-like cAMP-binding protein
MVTQKSLVDPAMQNKLLAALPDDERERVIRDLTRVFLPLGEILYEPGARGRQVYFPTSALVSLSYIMADGASVEAAVIGNDGVAGIALFLADASTPYRAVVRSAGWAYSLAGPQLKQELALGGAMLQLLLNYTQALIAQIMQTAACNRHHSIDQQLCRWLLLRLDRMGADELSMTQEAIAEMVGVPPASVVEALGQLRTAGMLHDRDGHVTVVDRAGLEARACECYGVVKQESERLFHRAASSVKAAPADLSLVAS